MKRLMTTVVTLAMVAASSGAASAEPRAEPPPSCVALITSYEAQLAPGFVGHEVSGLATSGPGLGTALVSPLAHKHLGSFESCREAEG
jgi:hypothetical protein